MSKKKPVPPVSKPMQKMTAQTRKGHHFRDSDEFRRCRPKRDWETAVPAERDVSSIKEVSGCRAR